MAVVSRSLANAGRGLNSEHLLLSQLASLVAFNHGIGGRDIASLFAFSLALMSAETFGSLGKLTSYADALNQACHLWHLPTNY